MKIQIELDNDADISLVLPQIENVLQEFKLFDNGFESIRNSILDADDNKVGEIEVED
jgi:hypothetical protein